MLLAIYEFGLDVDLVVLWLLPSWDVSFGGDMALYASCIGVGGRTVVVMAG